MIDPFATSNMWQPGLLEKSDNSNQLIGTCATLGLLSDHSTFNSKLMGFVEVLLTLKYVSQTPKMKQTAVVVACDGKSALL